MRWRWQNFRSSLLPTIDCIRKEILILFERSANFNETACSQPFLHPLAQLNVTVQHIFFIVCFHLIQIVFVIHHATVTVQHAVFRIITTHLEQH